MDWFGLRFWLVSLAEGWGIGDRRGRMSHWLGKDCFLNLFRFHQLAGRTIVNRVCMCGALLRRSSWIRNTIRSSRPRKRRAWKTRRRCWCTVELNAPISRSADSPEKWSPSSHNWSASSAPKPSAAKRWANCWKISPRYAMSACCATQSI